MGSSTPSAALTSPSRRGEVFGLLGPNGAGKTTTVEILEGYRTREWRRGTGARAWIPSGVHVEFRSRVGIVLQSTGLYRHIRVREAVASLRLHVPPSARRRRGDRARRAAGARRTRCTRTLSGGQSRRLDLALALVGDPEVIFLDEPTTGFDPAARRAAWDTIRSLRELGKTVLLTTHDLDEAQALADRVAIIKDGRILVEGAGRASSAPRPRHRVRIPRPRRRARRAGHREPDGAPADQTDWRRARSRRASGGSERLAARRSRTSTSS